MILYQDNSGWGYHVEISWETDEVTVSLVQNNK